MSDQKPSAAALAAAGTITQKIANTMVKPGNKMQEFADILFRPLAQYEMADIIDAALADERKAADALLVYFDSNTECTCDSTHDVVFRICKRCELKEAYDAARKGE